MSGAVIRLVWWLHLRARKKEDELPAYRFAIDAVALLVVMMTAHLGVYRAVSIRPVNPARLMCQANVALLLALAPLSPPKSVFSFAWGTGSSQSRTRDVAKVAVKAAYEAYLRAWRDKDYDALNKLLSDDYQAVNFQGVISTKANEIATAKNYRTYDMMTGDVRSVAVFGESAVVSGLIEASWKDESGTIQKSTFRFLAMLQRQTGGWKLVATQSTKFHKPAEPVER